MTFQTYLKINGKALPVQKDDYSIDYNDVNTSIVKTAVGNTIMVQLNCANPRPYTRMGLLVGTKGVFGTYPARAAVETAPGVIGKTWMDEKAFAELRREYAHPLVLGSLSKYTAGGVPKHLVL